LESRDAVRLTGEAGSDDIHASTPGSPVECVNIVPDWEGLKDSVVLSLHEGFSSLSGPLDGADDTVAEELVGKDPSP
jgi:hypothetical protein